MDRPMKITAITGDTALKVGLGLVGLFLVYRAYQGAKQAAADAAASIYDAGSYVVDKLDPTSPNNVAYQTVNTGFGGLSSAIGGATAPGMNADGSWTLGGWLYDVLNPVQAYTIRNISKP